MMEHKCKTTISDNKSKKLEHINFPLGGLRGLPNFINFNISPSHYQVTKITESELIIVLFSKFT